MLGKFSSVTCIIVNIALNFTNGTKNQLYVVLYIHPDISRMQYADDVSLYSRCRVKDLSDCVSSVPANLTDLTTWSSLSNLALNPKKTEVMLFSTPQMASVHSLRERNLNINVSSNILKRVQSKELLGVYFQEHLK